MLSREKGGVLDVLQIGGVLEVLQSGGILEVLQCGAREVAGLICCRQRRIATVTSLFNDAQNLRQLVFNSRTFCAL